jgi:DtxR family transcriptional regulator, manganese transport regulator
MNLERKDRHHGLGLDAGSTESREDYLACIYELIAKKGYARVADIADSLTVAEPSVSAMIKRLAKKGYVRREKYRGFTLTESGQTMAQSVHLRRRILTAFLRSLGLPHEVITQDVHGLEHHLSKQTLQCLRRFLKADVKSDSPAMPTNLPADALQGLPEPRRCR